MAIYNTTMLRQYLTPISDKIQAISKIFINIISLLGHSIAKLTEKVYSMIIAIQQDQLVISEISWLINIDIRVQYEIPKFPFKLKSKQN